MQSLYAYLGSTHYQQQLDHSLPIYFFYYIGVKLIILCNYHPNISLPIWTEEDTELFAAVCMFLVWKSWNR